MSLFFGRKEYTNIERFYNVKKMGYYNSDSINRRWKRMYAMKMYYFHAQSLKYIFVNHISRDALITTEKSSGYNPSFTMIHQVKS